VRIESRKVSIGAAMVAGIRTPRRRVDAQSVPGSLKAMRDGLNLRIVCDVHAGPSQQPRSMALAFGETETAEIRRVLLHNLGPTDARELAQLRELRDDVRAFVSDAAHGLGPDLIRLIRAMERLP
jgi:hypothetical protein